MSGFTSSRLRTSVCATAAVTITALIAWSFDTYIGYVHQDSDLSVPTAQVESITFDNDTRNG